MNLSNTGGGGRGADDGKIIGDVLVKGRKEFWLRGGNYHYHHGMKPGENTLDTLVGGLMIKCLNQLSLQSERDLVKMYSAVSTLGKLKIEKNLFTETFLEKIYIPFMTSKDSHNDTYVATAHRMYFANLVVRKTSPYEAADNDGHNTDSVDGLINAGIASMNQFVTNKDALTSEKDGQVIMHKVLSDSINVIRQSQALSKWAVVYHNLLKKLILDEIPLRQAILETIQEDNSVGLGKMGLNKQSLDDFAKTGAQQDPMSACYVNSNFPVTLMLAYKYHDSFSKAVLASCNAGGENVNRNALLGTIMGAAVSGGETGRGEIKEWFKGLVKRDEIAGDIRTFVGALQGSEGKRAEL